MIRPLALGLAVLAAAAAAWAQENSIVAAHMEGCLVWNSSGSINARNECGRPIAVKFMAFDDQRVIESDVPPGGRFESGASWGQSGGYMFTACPAGYQPSVRFALENRTPIEVSLYNCLPGKPNA